jgi:glycerophosphoryl diester phosphodiesterase
MTKIFAHRGARAAAPENTLPAFQMALDMNADGIELDVHCSADGALVVIHDFVVDRTTDGNGKVGELSLNELKDLDAGGSFSADYAGTRIPTLDEVLDLVGDQCIVDVEIKSVDTRGGDEVDLVAKTIADRGLYDQVMVSSFNPISLIRMRHADPRVRLGLVYREPLPDYLRNAWLSPIIAPEALHPHHHLIDTDLMAQARELNKAVNTWTVNEVEEAKRLVALGVDTIISVVPDVILAGLAGVESGAA